MIFGIGTDIVSVERIQVSLQRYGEKFARRILTGDEFREFSSSTNLSAHFLAKRFAAKEAAAKAMGTGFRDGLTLSQIGTTHDDHGKPSLVYYGKAKEFIEQKRISRSHLSVSDERQHALAFVTLECLAN